MIYKFKENRVRRAYMGGKRIDSFCGKKTAADSRYPELWLASAVEAFNPDLPTPGEGLSICEDGRLFRDVLKENPTALLGEALSERYGGNLSILVKLLDSAQRLVIQCHPTTEFARTHFHSMFGKTECWYMLDCEEDACVYFGFRPGITKEYWLSLFEKQDIEGMLSALHRFPVRKGDLWFVSGGVPHAIGGGCLMIELQEPSDWMVIPERVTPAGIPLAEQKLHGGLGFDKMFDCFVYKGLSEAETKKRFYRRPMLLDNTLVPVVDASLTDCFSMKALRVKGCAEADMHDRYAVVVVTRGSGTLETADETISLSQSDSFFIPACSGKLKLRGDLELVFCIA